MAVLNFMLCAFLFVRRAWYPSKPVAVQHVIIFLGSVATCWVTPTCYNRRCCLQLVCHLPGVCLRQLDCCAHCGRHWTPDLHVPRRTSLFVSWSSCIVPWSQTIHKLKCCMVPCCQTMNVIEDWIMTSIDRHTRSQVSHFNVRRRSSRMKWSVSYLGWFVCFLWENILWSRHSAIVNYELRCGVSAIGNWIFVSFHR